MTCRAITHHKCFHRVLEASTTRGAIDRHDAALKSRCAMPCRHASLKNRLPTTCVSIGSAPRVTPGKSNIVETFESDKQHSDKAIREHVGMSTHIGWDLVE